MSLLSSYDPWVLMLSNFLYWISMTCLILWYNHSTKKHHLSLWHMRNDIINMWRWVRGFNVWKWRDPDHERPSHPTCLGRCLSCPSFPVWPKLGDQPHSKHPKFNFECRPETVVSWAFQVFVQSSSLIFTPPVKLLLIICGDCLISLRVLWKFKSTLTRQMLEAC